MHKQAKSAIRDLVLDLRETLEGEVERELRRHGIYAERAWMPADDLDHLTDEERSQHRPCIEAAIACLEEWGEERRREQEQDLPPVIQRLRTLRAQVRQQAAQV